MKSTLSRTTLSEQIAQRLIEYIFEEQLTPGDALPGETKLAENFGVSRPVIREALKSLTAQGFIEVINGKGAFVKPVDDSLLRLFFTQALQVEQAELVELLEIRESLEIQSAALAAERRTAEEAAQLREIVSHMGANLTNLEIYAEFDVAFHLQIATCAHNTILHHLINAIRDALKAVVLKGLYARKSAAQLEKLQQTHEAIATAIEEQAVDQAISSMSHHFDEALEVLGSLPKIDTA